MATDIIARGMASDSGGVSEEEVKRISQEAIDSSLIDFKGDIVTTRTTFIENYTATCKSELGEIKVGYIVTSYDPDNQDTIQVIDGEWWLSSHDRFPIEIDRQIKYTLFSENWDDIEGHKGRKLVPYVRVKSLGMPFAKDTDLSGWSLIDMQEYKYDFYTLSIGKYINNTSLEEKEFMLSIVFHIIYFKLYFIDLDPNFTPTTNFYWENRGATNRSISPVEESSYERRDIE